MLEMAISLLWLLIIAIVFCGVIYLVLYGVNQYIHPIPERVTQGLWFVVLLLMVIYVLMVLAGQAPRVPSFR